MNTYTRLYIDFDGVICDSVYEAFVCSYLAYNNLRKLPAIEHANVDKERELFYRYRPFIRIGQHLLLLQHCIKHNITLSSQDDFEAQLATISDEQSQQWREALYTVRAQLIDEQLTEYVNLHTLYPYVTTHLPSLLDNPNVRILSTKKPHLISLLLSNAGIAWPSDQLLMSHRHSKIDIIQSERSAPVAVERYAFIDDHLPHILSIEEGNRAGIDCYLADWGYTLPEWKQDARYRHLDGDSASQLVASFYSS